MTGQQLKDSILQMAIQGKLVPQDPNDEPASVLLERIREERKRLVKEGALKKKDLEEKPISPEEIPFDIPEGWVWCKLSTIASVYGGKRIPVGSSLTTINTGHRYIRVSDMKNGSVRLNDIHYISEDIYQQIKAYTISKNDLYITVAGTIGAVGEIPDTLDMANLTENADKIVFSITNKRFLMYLLQSDFIQSQIKSYTTKVGQPKLAINKIQNFLIPLPPLAEQQRIVEKIEELMPIIERYGKSKDALDKLNASLPDKLRQSILQEAIQGRLVPQDSNDEPASVLLDKIRKEKMRLVKEGKLKKKDLEEKTISPEEIPFDIPEGWEWIRLNNLALVARGGSPRPIKDYITESPDGINWIKIGDTEKGGKYINSCEEKIKPEGVQRSRMVHPGDFLLTNSMSFGRPYITNVEGCIHDGWLVISQYYKGFDTDFLYYLLSSPFAYTQFSEKTAGAVVQNLNKDKVAESIFPLPPLSEQQRIVTKIEELMPKIDRLMK